MTIAIIGATGHLGVSICERLAKREPVLLGYHQNVDRAKSLEASLRASGSVARCVQVDIHNPDSVESFLSAADKLDGGLTGVLSAEGSAFPVLPLAEASSGDMLEMLQTDVIGSLNLLRASVPRLEKNGGGSIVLFLTACIINTLANDALSSVPKNAVAMMIRQLAREAGPANIRINGVAPGVIETDKVADMSQLPDRVRDMVETCLANTPMGRKGTTGEVAALCDFLLSGDAAYISGQVIAIDGAYSA